MSVRYRRDSPFSTQTKEQNHEVRKQAKCEDERRRRREHADDLCGREARRRRERRAEVSALPPSGLSVLPPDHLRVLPPDPRRVLPGGCVGVVPVHPPRVLPGGGVGVVPVHPPRVLPGGGVGVIPVDPKGVVPKSTTFRRRGPVLARRHDLRPHRRDDASRLPQAGDARRGDPRTAEPIA